MSNLDPGLNFSVWERELADDVHPDQEFLLQGISEGFRVTTGNVQSFPTVEMSNYKSATNELARSKVEKQIIFELESGHYQISNVKPHIISALGAVPKKDSSDIRIIHDCSQPRGKAVNDFVKPQVGKQKYQTIDDALRLIKPGYYMAKIDLKHAYRSVRVHVHDHQALGCKWHFSEDDKGLFTYMFDTRLPFGAKLSPTIFHKITQAVRRMMSRRGFDLIVAYLDDFLIIGESLQACRLAFDTLLELLQELGFRINWQKVVPPTQKLVFLGIEINSLSRQISLPPTKLAEFVDLLACFHKKTHASMHQLQQLAGKLNWACRVIHGGRTFLRRILELMNKLPTAKGKIRLNRDCKADLSWWYRFIQTFNGTRFFLDDIPVTDLSTDSSTEGGGAYFRGDWFYVNWRLDFPAANILHINYKEILAALLAIQRWAPCWRNSRVILYSDSQTAVSILNKGTCKEPLVMSALRETFWLSAHFNFHLTARHIPGKQNTMADKISRLHEQTHRARLFQSLCDNNLSILRRHVSDRWFFSSPFRFYITA